MEDEDRKLESVELVKYLGMRISGDGRMEKIGNRLGKASSKVIGALSEPIWKQKEQSRKTKVKAYVIVVPSLMYGCETWVQNKRQESAGQSTEMRVLRRLVKKSRVDRARNVEISKELKHEGMLEKVRRSQGDGEMPWQRWVQRG